MSRSFLVIAGPPGTGKTRRLAEGVARAAAKVGPERILIVSLTKAAAVEIASRVELPERNVGTLHSMCHRLLERMPLATDKKKIGEWNAQHPAWQLKATGEAAGMADDPLGESHGGGREEGADTLLEESSILRHLRRPKILWPRHLVDFDAAWKRWKNDAGVIDFTDMIELAAERRLAPPGDPAVLVVDEAQDLSPLETEVVRLWSGQVESTVVAGDSDQVLFSWRGSVPELFLPGAVPDDSFEVLEQSYRVPRAAHAEAMRIITECSDRRPITYLPTAERGTVELGDSFMTPGRLIERAVEHAKDPSLGRFMLIAPCAFSLEPIVRGLKEEGVPFHNPYKLSQGRWNPLGVRKGTTSASRVLSFTAMARQGRPWTAEEFRAWATGLDANRVWKRGVKTQIERDDFAPPATVDGLRWMMRQPEEVSAVLESDLAWYRDRAQATLKDRLAYPIAVAARWGSEALVEEPRTVIGTIHSVKGGEASVVALSGDLSPKGIMTRDAEPDVIRRMIYVGMTRTSRDLILARPSRSRMSAAMW